MCRPDRVRDTTRSPRPGGGVAQPPHIGLYSIELRKKPITRLPPRRPPVPEQRRSPGWAPVLAAGEATGEVTLGPGQDGARHCLPPRRTSPAPAARRAKRGGLARYSGMADRQLPMLAAGPAARPSGLGLFAGYLWYRTGTP